MSFTFQTSNGIRTVAADKFWVDKYGIYFTDNNDKLIQQFDIMDIDFNTLERES